MDGTEIEQDSPISPATVRGTPWGLWPTLGFSILLAIMVIVIQSVVVVAFLLAADGRGEPPGEDVSLADQIEKTAYDGTTFSSYTVVTAIVVPCCCLLFAWLRPGISLKDYMALRCGSVKQIFIWMGIASGLAALLDLITILMGRPLVPDFMLDLYHTIEFRPLLWLAVIVAAPVAEEFIFRGFIFTGLQHSWCDNIGAVLITSVVWACLHLQYDLYSMVSIFLVGLVLGYARIRTNSLLVPIGMHALHNLIATFEVTIKAHQA